MWSFCRKRRFYLKHPYKTVDPTFLPEPIEKPLNPASLTPKLHAKVSGLLSGFRGRELEARREMAKRQLRVFY